MSQSTLEITERIVYATIATVDETGQPWNSPVFSAVDRDLNVYWGSHRNSQHSKNIRANGKVFVVIYDSTVPPGAGEGVYIMAIGRELTDESAIVTAHSLLQQRRPTPFWKLNEVQGDAPIRLYKAEAQKVWRNGEGAIDGTYIDTLEEATV